MLWSGLRNNKGQVMPFLVLLIAVLLLAIAATMLIGEAAYNKVRLSNVADGALISGASGYARSLNQLRQINNSMYLAWITASVEIMFSRMATGCSTCIKPPIAIWADYAQPLTDPSVIMSYYNSKQAYDQAKEIAKNIAKDLRSGLYDSVFSGALTDEPKPFLETTVAETNEVYRDPNPPHAVTGFNFKHYPIP